MSISFKNIGAFFPVANFLRYLSVFALVASVFLLSSFPVFAYESPGQPSGFVNDFAGLLSAEEKAILEARLATFSNESSNEISIVIVSSLGGDTIDNFAVRLFEDWQIGKKGLDNGVLLLVAPVERQMRLEVGYGLEGALPDAVAYQIVEKELKPAFQSENYYAGFSVAVDQIIAATKGEYEGLASAEAGSAWRSWSGDAVFFALFIIYALLSSARRRLAKTKRWWPGGVWGAVLGLIIALLFFRTLTHIIALPTVFFGLGLLFDYLVSRVLPPPKNPGGRGGPGIFLFPGGGRSGGGFGGGGFGGFGGGRSGGGGFGGSW